MSEKQFQKTNNISLIFITTAAALIVTEITSIITNLIDGVISSRFLDIAVYSGISLLKPLTRLISVIYSFLSTGCNVACSQLVGTGKREEAQQVFNLCILIGLVLSAVLLIFCQFFPAALFTISGISLTKYPEFIPHLNDYLRGYMIGLPALFLSNVSIPILIMDNGKKAFTRSCVALCAVDLVSDLINVFVIHGGAFGMGLATSLSFIAQLLFLLPLLLNRKRYFHISLKDLRLDHLNEIIKCGTPAFTQKLAVALRDSAINYFNIMVALSSAAIAARGIQNDLLSFFFCIAIGLGRTLVTMAGVYYGANDRESLVYLFSYAMKLGIRLTGIASAAIFVFAPAISRIYTDIPDVLSLTVFSIRCMAVSLVFDTVIALIQYYLQGIGNLKQASSLTVLERFAAPVLCALVLGYFYGSKGVLASIAVGKIVLFVIMIIINIINLKRLPRTWTDIMYLPEGFGGKQTENMYVRITDIASAIETSEKTRDFCIEHGIDKKQANMMALFVEEMAVNVFEHARKVKYNVSGIDFRLTVNEKSVCFNMSDLGELFDPTDFYELHRTDSPEEHIGIRLVMNGAKEVRYYSSFNSNNLIVILDR